MCLTEIEDLFGVIIVCDMEALANLGIVLFNVDVFFYCMGKRYSETGVVVT